VTFRTVPTYAVFLKPIKVYLGLWTNVPVGTANLKKRKKERKMPRYFYHPSQNISCYPSEIRLYVMKKWVLQINKICYGIINFHWRILDGLKTLGVFMYVDILRHQPIFITFSRMLSMDNSPYSFLYTDIFLPDFQK